MFLRSAMRTTVSILRKQQSKGRYARACLRPPPPTPTMSSANEGSAGMFASVDLEEYDEDFLTEIEQDWANDARQSRPGQGTTHSVARSGTSGNGTSSGSASRLNIPTIPPPKSRDQTTTPDDFVCAVCYELPISAAKSLVTPCCQHLFCNECIAGVMRTSGVCPFCRTKLTERRAMEMKPVDGLAKRVFESVPVVCPRGGCDWKGCIGSYCHHAEECALAASVSDMSKLDVAKLLQKTQKELKWKTLQYNRAKETLDGMVDSMEEKCKDNMKIIEKCKSLKKINIRFKELAEAEYQKLEKKVEKLEKEKVELLAELDVAEEGEARSRKRERSCCSSPESTHDI